MGEKKPLNQALSTVKPFINGGLSGMGATCIIQPIDMVKVRIQIGAKGSPVSCGAAGCPHLAAPLYLSQAPHRMPDPCVLGPCPG